MNKRATLTLLTCLVCVLLSATKATGTTLIPMADDDLAVSSRAIVEARVTAVSAAWSPADEAVFTYVQLEVERSLKGPLAPGPLVLKQPGGTTPELATIIFGAPEFAPGQRLLLFLNADADGALHVAHLSLGLYRVERDADGSELLVRPPSGAVALAARDGAVVTDRAERPAFVERLERTLVEQADRVALFEAAASSSPVLVAPVEFSPGLVRVGSQPDFRFLGTGFRWFEPDTNAVIRFKVNPAGAPTSAGSMEEVRAAFAAWSTVPGSPLRVVMDGSTNVCGIKADSVNSVSFGDCMRQIDDPVNGSGVVARGGITNANPQITISVAGKSFARVMEGDIVVNNGFETLLANSSNLSEILAHELGHVLGFGHSSEIQTESNMTLRDATMFFIAHLDNRGGRLGMDDQDGARFVYGAKGGTLAPLVLQSAALPNAALSMPYSFTLVASGGSAPFTWSIASGSLPSGISLSASGVLTGTPTAAAEAQVTLRVRDSVNNEQTRAVSLRTTATPAPFVERASFNATKGKVTIIGRFIDATATVAINGLQIARPVKFKATKNQLTLSGSAVELNIRTGASNMLVVTLGGQSSNAATF